MAIPTKVIVQLGLFFLISRFDLSNPQILMVIRVVYAGVAFLLYIKFKGLKDQIEKKNDTREVWIPVKKASGLMDTFFGKATTEKPQEWTKTTMIAHELSLAKTKVDSSLMQLAQPFIMSFLMNLHVVLALNIIMQPLNQWEDPLMQRYVFSDGTQLTDSEGMPVPIYEERYTDPVAPTNEKVEDGAEIMSRNVAYEDAIVSTWASRDPVQLEQFEEFFQNGVDPNYKIFDSGWTLLMIVVAGIQNGKKDVQKLLDLGALPNVVDNDGSSALHWAAYHNSPLISVFGKYYYDESSTSPSDGASKRIGSIEDLKKLLLVKDKSNKTALDVAKDENNKAALDGIQSLYNIACLEVF